MPASLREDRQKAHGTGVSRHSALERFVSHGKIGVNYHAEGAIDSLDRDVATSDVDKAMLNRRFNQLLRCLLFVPVGI